MSENVPQLARDQYVGYTLTRAEVGELVAALGLARGSLAREAHVLRADADAGKIDPDLGQTVEKMREEADMRDRASDLLTEYGRALMARSMGRRP